MNAPLDQRGSAAGKAAVNLAAACASYREAAAFDGERQSGPRPELCRSCAPPLQGELEEGQMGPLRGAKGCAVGFVDCDLSCFQVRLADQYALENVVQGPEGIGPERPQLEGGREGRVFDPPVHLP